MRWFKHMSMEATQWAWGQSVRSTYKLVLLALADREYRIACRRIEEAYHSMSLFGVCEAKQGKPEQASFMEPRGGV